MNKILNKLSYNINFYETCSGTILDQVSLTRFLKVYNYFTMETTFILYCDF